jgi:2-oxoisovalerate dehydrogenase E2 component (dihydrolipoyl transacylase)
MSELKEFKLPDVGEGLTEAEIIKWHVQPGDEVTVNQIIVEIETAKAVVELPCPYEGVVSGLLVSEGTTADVGTPIIAVEVGAAAGSAGPQSAGQPEVGAEAGGSLLAAGLPQQAAAGGAPEDLIPALPGEGGVEPGVHGTLAPKPERQPVLVGYGVKLGPTTRRARQPGAGPAGPAPSGRAGAGPGGAGPGAAASHVLAKPPVRKLAKDLGIDLSGLSGTGPNGSITRDDVQTAASGGQAGFAQPAFAQAGPARDVAPPAVPAQAAPGQAAPAPVRYQRSAAGPREQRIAIRGVRKHTAAAVAGSAFTAPHVTEFLQVDVTETMAATARVKTLPEFSGARVSPLLFVARALLVAVARHPMINSSWDESAQEIVVKNYVNLGIAATTDRGLVVPNVKDAHLLALPDLAQALTELAETARAGRASVADMQSGTITITNVGVFGVDAGTPILSPGEAAILAFGQVKDTAWVHQGELAVRKVTTLSLSFDHRIVDGDLGSAVLRDIGAMLEDPLRILVWS